MKNISTYGMLDVIFNNIDHSLFVANSDPSDFHVLYINDSSQTLGIEKEALYNEPFLLFKKIHPDDKKDFIQYFISAVQKNEMMAFDIRIIKSNQVCWLNGRFIPVLGPYGVVNRVVGVAIDVTDRKVEEFRLGNLYKIQGDVIKILAHDLRTPISAIKILAESELGSNQLSKSHVNSIISNCNQTLALMEDLLSYIQSDSEHIKVNRNKIIVEEYFNLVIESF